MKILNLANKANSDITYEMIQYPDGQSQIKIVPYQIGAGMQGYTYPVTIKARLNNFKDLELILCATWSLRNLGVKEIHLYVPYFLGSRSDRQFEEGSNNYLKQIICPIINLQGFKSVTVLDPHSDVLEACLNGFKKVSNVELVKDVIWNSICVGPGFVDTDKLRNIVLVSPDAGASKKIYKIAEQIGYKGDIITCSKDRDENGKLTKCVVPDMDKYYNRDVIIIDDICDGGGTFINIAKEIKAPKAYRHTGNVYLIVTHSIFSKGTDELLKYFDRIYTTNSYKEHNVEKVKVLNIF